MKEYLIYWTDEAFNDLLSIEDFLGKPHSTKIIAEIILSTDQLIANPFSGTIQDLPLKKQYRYLVVGNYKILYSIHEKIVYINTIFDTRQNPDLMVGILKSE
jgi:mRNA-degrading endonuclease RelE of RelBE toxin-antitoxin system